MSTISIWNDQIIFNWSGEVPPGCNIPLSHLREKPDLLLPYWTIAGPHMRYSKTKRFFFLSFSQQNLRRLRDQFGDKIELKTGKQRIEQLKQELNEFKSLSTKVTNIKNGAYEDPVQYKMPPLGTYQDIGTKMLIHNPKSALFVDCGCLSGKTVISFNRAGCTRKASIEDLWRNQEAPAKNRKEHVKTYVRSFKGDQIGLNPIVKIVRQGVKKTFTLRLSDGKSVRATADHEILTSCGWKELGELLPGDRVMVDNVGIYKTAKGLMPKRGTGVPDYSPVESVVSNGEEMTYDIVCEDPHRNFVADGIVVHNCGKTFMSLVSTQEQFRRGLLTPGKVLVCGKLATLETGWYEDCFKFTHMKPIILWLGQVKNRKQKLIDLLNTPADIYIINHDGVRLLEEELVKKEFEKVIVDESTILKSYVSDRANKGKFGQALMRVSHKAKWRVIMSGTPAPNGPEDLWGQIHFLDPQGFMLERSVHDFRAKYMNTVYMGDPRNPNTPKKYTPKNGTVEKVADLISPITFRAKIRDNLKDLPEKTIIKRLSHMSDEQEKHYLQMDKLLSTEINNKIVDVDMALTKLGKLRQITGGFLIDHNEETHPIEDNPKINLLDDLLYDEIDSSEKVVIYAQFQYEIELIESRYKDMGVCSVYGGNSSTTNLANIKSFINDKSKRICLLHPRSAAHGITLVCSHFMVFYSISHSAEENYQSQARIERNGQKHPMFMYYLLCRDTIDEIIYTVVANKQYNQDKLLDQAAASGEILKLWSERSRKRGQKKVSSI